MSLLDSYLAPDDFDAADHGHVCPDCDLREACGLSLAHCPEPELAPCAHCAAPVGYAVDCAVCQLYGEPHPERDDAAQLAGRHDEMHHRGVPTATVTAARIPA